MIAFFHAVFYKPLLNALVLIYAALPFRDFGAAIILLTIFIRVLLLPLFYKGARDQAILQRLAPRVQALKEEHKNDRQAQAKAMFALYREHKVNPLVGFLLLLVQLPILFALYQVFLSGLSADALRDLYAFIPPLENVDTNFLGALDMAKPSVILAVLAGASQFLLGRMTLPASSAHAEGKKSADSMAAMGRQMVYLGPLFIIFTFVYFKLPAAVGLYWLTTTVFSIMQQVVINRRLPQNV